MKKYINLAFIYALAAMAGGVFYREFTKYNGFSGTTALGKVHIHFFALGMIVFLLVALLDKEFNLAQQKTFRVFLTLYNIGLPLTGIMMLVRGIAQVSGMELSKAVNAAISGTAGIGHVFTGAGIVLLLLSLKKSIKC